MNDDVLPVELLADPAVRAFVTAVNAQDREAFEDALAPGATMSDDGTERDLAEWTEREIFASNGRMDVLNQTDDGRTLVARYRNDTYGEMRTRWQFTVEGGKVARFETGQAS
ncbi:nuclear transport factor 2 family protein [Streptomyces sp. Da 82-17]|uniref:nuclear transport factor 2 family protein n=1 Tax=Streptomyces sp. Da 82-17 TaxID=3377116 RepID=UPI0038D4406B